MHLYSASHLILLSSVLLLLSAFTSGVTNTENKKNIIDPKPITCCKKLTTNEPMYQIEKCYILPGTEKCLKSVVFVDTINRMHCIDPTAPWLERRIRRLEKNGVKCKDYTQSLDFLN